MGEPELSLINFLLNSFVKDIFHDTVEKRCSFTAAIYFLKSGIKWNSVR